MGLAQLGGAIPPPLPRGIPVLNRGACPVPLLLQPGSILLAWSSPAPLQEGCGEEGCLRQSKVLPPPLASTKVFAVSSVRTLSSRAFPLQTDFPALPALLGCLSIAYVKAFAFPEGPSSTQGVGVGKTLGSHGCGKA